MEMADVFDDGNPVLSEIKFRDVRNTLQVLNLLKLVVPQLNLLEVGLVTDILNLVDD